MTASGPSMLLPRGLSITNHPKATLKTGKPCLSPARKEEGKMKNEEGIPTAFRRLSAGGWVFSLAVPDCSLLTAHCSLLIAHCRLQAGDKASGIDSLACPFRARESWAFPPRALPGVALGYDGI